MIQHIILLPDIKHICNIGENNALIMLLRFLYVLIQRVELRTEFVCIFRFSSFFFLSFPSGARCNPFFIVEMVLTTRWRRWQHRQWWCLWNYTNLHESLHLSSQHTHTLTYIYIFRNQCWLKNLHIITLNT